MLDELWEFVRDPTNRETLGWIAGGIGAAIGGAWVVVKFLVNRRVGATASVIKAEGGSVSIGRDNICSSINVNVTGISKKK